MFHGSRAHFDRFDESFCGTGEGVRGQGFYFTGSLYGACVHAKRLASQQGDPVVYVCTFRPEQLWLTRGVPIAEHPKLEQRAWDAMPLCYSSLDGVSDWYERLLSVDYREHPDDHQLREAEKFRLLNEFGFSAIGDYEGAHAEPYHEGATSLLLRSCAVEILEAIPVDDIWDRVRRQVSFRVADRPASHLGVMTRLRVVT